MLRVTPGTFVPDLGIEYPTDPSVRMLTVKKTREIEFDENYPYYEESRKRTFHNILVWMKNEFLVLPLQKLLYGLRIEGRENLKKYEKELSHGALTICNHAYRWDFCAVWQALPNHFFRIPMFADNFCTSDYWNLWSCGGVPIPASMSAMKKYNEAFDRYHELGYWFHVFPEGIRWNFYKPLKPFMKGAFTMSYKYNIPILPLCITYRERTGWHKWIGPKKEPLITITIGEPIYPDTTANRKQEVDRLLHVSHETLMRMAGIVENPWPIEG